MISSQVGDLQEALLQTQESLASYQTRFQDSEL